MILRKANSSELAIIWEILQAAIAQRKQEGSQQWQDGYPNPQSIQEDLNNGWAYLLAEGQTILAYAAIIFDVEPAYNTIEGKWLSEGKYVVIHRVATSSAIKKKGIATRLFEMIETLSIENKTYSIKVDTNFDNVPMLRILDKQGYTYCGQVYFRGSARRAYEKILS